MEPLASSSPPNSQLSTSPSTPKSKVFIFTEYKEKEDGSDLISIQNFESFLSKVYRDVLFSYHSFLRFSEKPLNAISINFEGFKENKFSEFKNQINKGTITLEQINRSLSDISKKQVDEIRKKMEDEIKKDCSLPHFFNRIFIKDSDTNIGLLNSNQYKVCLKEIYFEFKENIIEFLEKQIEQLKKDDWNVDWVKSLKIKILKMSKVYVNFKKSKKDEIEETFHLLRYHYSEIIERIKKKKNCGFIFILDDIFLRVFKWVDKKPQSNTDSILLRNAFSHFNIVYDEQSLNDAGPVFEKMFLKSNTYENFENFKNGLLDQGYSDVNQRIILYNIKDKDSLEADAMLDTNVYQVCRYFMTFCHCLYAIFSNQLYDVPFSQTLLEQFSETYGLKLQGNSSKSFTMKGIKIKNCTINTQTEVTEVTEERELDQTNNLSITSNDDKNMVFTLTTFCNLTVHAKGTEVYLDNKLLETGQAQTLFSGAVSIKSKSFQIEDGILRIENGRIETKPIKQDDYILIVEEGGELNIRGGSITIFPNTNSTFSVQVRGVNEKDGAKNVITTIFGLGTISCNKYPITFSKSLFGETSKCYGNLRVETGSHVTVCNPTLLTIKCTKGSVKVYTIKGYDMNENDDYIRFYTHKTNYMEDNMNQKLIAISPQKLKPSPSITTTKSPAQSHKLKK